MVDLASQYRRLQPEMDQAMKAVLNSTAFIQGPAIQQFQAALEKYLDVPHVIPCANGTDALQLAFMALELQPGDEVIVPTFTYIATVEVLALLRLKPILVDVDPQTFNLDITQVESVISARTKAIVPVHLFGQCANTEPLLEIAKKHNLFVIEDAAQALGTDYIFANGKKQKAGTLGIIGCTSFFPSKNLGCYGDGGALFTANEKLARKLKAIANHGQREKYKFEYVGINSRLDSLQAAVLNVKLPHLDHFNKTRQQVAAHYDSAFSKHPFLTIPHRSTYSTHTFHQYTLQVGNQQRDALKEHLLQHNVPCMIYYPFPVHSQPAYKDSRYPEGSFPVSEKLCKSVLSLPVHTEMDDEQLVHITQTVLSFFR